MKLQVCSVSLVTLLLLKDFIFNTEMSDPIILLNKIFALAQLASCVT
ncbi:hypothetical protein XELAEV_18035668mg [Xenopus laevis]|uniref:Uncharacterized protein n=1 Tax=Xenopus laevis TaxID=8355 RepID=A0A974CG55_XENLA|nr:hypothetical protein XELAEV_18035668mg [Xenopus laevis]